MRWLKALFSTHRSASHKSPKAPLIRKRHAFEYLEDRCCLSYTFQVVAHTEGANPGFFHFTGFSEAPAINDAGVVSFVGQQPAGGEGVFSASGNPPTLQRLEGSTLNRAIGNAASIDDEGQIATTIRLDADSLNPQSFRVKKYPSDVTIVTAGRLSDDFPNGAALQDYVGVGFDAKVGRIIRSVVYAVVRGLNNPNRSVDIWEDINGVAKQVTSSSSRPIIPAVADGGAFVVQTQTPSNEPIILYKPQFDGTGVFTTVDETFIAGRTRFSDLERVLKIRFRSLRVVLS